MKAIFLDIDGVLNCISSKSKCGHYIGIDNSKLKLLKKIIDETGAKVILSSTWRIGWYKDKEGKLHQSYDSNYMDNKFSKFGIKIMDSTPVRNGNYRGNEIMESLKEHPEIDKWIVLDDEYFVDFHECGIVKHWIKTDFYDNDGGLQQEHVEKAINMLNNV